MEHWPLWAQLLASALGSSVVLSFVGWAVLGRLAVTALRKAKAEFKEFVDELMAERWKQLEKNTTDLIEYRNELRDLSRNTERQAEEFTDRLEAVDASILAQGRSLQEAMEKRDVALIRAMDDVSKAVQAVAREAKETSVAVARIEGALGSNEWDGNDRRGGRGPRRRADQHEEE